MNNSKQHVNNILIVLMAIVTIYVVIYGTFLISTNYISNSNVYNGDNNTIKTECRAAKAKHTVYINNDKVYPKNINTSLCDTLQIINQDGIVRIIAFGEHEKHIAYDGIKEQAIATQESVSVTLNMPGEFTFHDHNQEDVKGNFTVR